MNDAVLDITGKMRRVLGAQLAVGAILGVVLFVAAGPLQGASALYGGLIGLLLTLLLGRSVQKASEVAKTDPKGGMTTLYIGATQRFVFVLAALAVGLALFKLSPLAVATGFAAAQLAQLINARGGARNDEEGPTP